MVVLKRTHILKLKWSIDHDDELEHLIGNKSKAHVACTTEKTKSSDGPSPLKKAKKKLKPIVEQINTTTNTQHATTNQHLKP